MNCSQPDVSRMVCRLLLGGLVASGLLSVPIAVRAADQEVDSQRAMRSLARQPWYDSQADSYKPPQVSPARDNDLRSKGRVAAVKTKTPWNWNWQPLWDALSYLFSWASLSILAAIALFALLALIIHSLRNYAPVRNERMLKVGRVEIDAARVSSLPFDVVRSQGDPLSEAEMLRRAGRYNEAIVYLYGYMLLALDQTRKIHLQKGRTNRMYLRELKLTALKRIVEPTMLAFEEVFFGKHSISQERFELLWGQLDDFHRLLATDLGGESTGVPTGKVAPV
ncbi:MAG: hypothetical protein R3C53_15320 [Pirellulaceae bacterium]